MNKKIRDELLTYFEKNKDIIKTRIQSFKNKWINADDSSLFDELIYTILAAGSSALSAQRGEKCLMGIIDKDWDISKIEIQSKLKNVGCRFHTIRGGYIFEAYEKIKSKSFKKEIEKRVNNNNDIRDYLVSEFKGIGYKEASHFLRNIGIFGFAILDKHILNSLSEFGAIDEIPKNIGRRDVYLEYEKVFIKIAKELNLSVEELDLVLWSRKTGKVMK